jgi:nucleoside 2-deoxyribosyltransferase
VRYARTIVGCWRSRYTVSHGGLNVSELPRVYVASPLGFTAAGRSFNVVVKSAISDAGLVPIDPWDPERGLPLLNALRIEDTMQRQISLRAADRAIGANNAEDIRRCAGLMALLDGSDIDSGTAAEIGFAAALGKPIVGCRTDFRHTGDNEGVVVNLQVEYFITMTGGDVIVPMSNEPDTSYFVRSAHRLRDIMIETT